MNPEGMHSKKSECSGTALQQSGFVVFEKDACLHQVSICIQVKIQFVAVVYSAIARGHLTAGGSIGKCA